MERQYHISLCGNDVGKYVIMPGDPGRCKFIASYLEEPKFIATNREFTTYSGFLSGEKVTVTSSGIGGPSTAIALEELARCGADTFIRVGTCGGIQKKVKPGDVIVVTGAVRQEGTSREYAPIEFPAVADLTIATALSDACRNLNYSYHCGIVQCKDSYYGQHEPERMPVSYELQNKWNAWKKLGVLASEMETAAMFTVGHALGIKCGAVLNVFWNQEREADGIAEEHNTDTTKAIKASVEAIKKLIKEQSLYA